MLAPIHGSAFAARSFRRPRPGRYRMALWSVVLALAGPAGAQTLEVIERAYEATLETTSFPTSTVGTLTLRVCDTCELVAMQVSPDTAYIAPDGSMALGEFLAYVDTLRHAPASETTTYVAVFQSIADGRVTRVKLGSKP